MCYYGNICRILQQTRRNEYMDKSNILSMPKVGMRNIKTATAAALCALIYLFFPGRSPAFACIGAIFGMGGNLEQSKLHGGNRFFGTIIGGFTFSWMQKFYTSHHHKPRQSKKGD